MERHPTLALRKGDPIANVRMECMEKTTMAEYFELLKTTLTENNLLDKPHQIYNVDETGMPFDHRPPKVVTSVGQKKVRSRTSGNKSQVTVIACVSAAGQVIPPFVIFDAKMLNHDWTIGEVPGTRYGLSDTGWVDTYLFKRWLKDHLLEHAVASRPLLLILDGHGSHYQPELIEYARDNGVILLCLPPHTTHESQPLDTCVFKPLKQNWQEACNRYMQKNPGRVVTKYSFSTLLNEAWGKTMVPTVISSGFRRSGIYPFNPEALDYGEVTNPSSNEQAGDQPSTSFQKDKTVPTFTPEQETLFARRFEESYDLVDPLYSQWLEINHPQELQNTIEEDHQFEEYIREVVNSQEDLTQVVINDDIAVEPANLVDQSECAGSSREQSTLNVLNQSSLTIGDSNKTPSNAEQGKDSLTAAAAPRTVACPLQITKVS